MKRFFSSLSSTKKMLGITAVCGALVLSIGTGATFAEKAESGTKSGLKDQFEFKTQPIVKAGTGPTLYSNNNGKNKVQFSPNEAIPNQKFALNEKKLQVRTQNGKTEFSTDGGKTWSKTPPKDVIVGKDGSIIFTTDDKSLDPNKGAKSKLLVRQIKGKTEFSTDDGKTWSKTPPKGVIVGKNGSIIYTQGDKKFHTNKGAKGNVMIKETNGKTEYSTNDGKTWSKNPPNGIQMEQHGQQHVVIEH
ncbi:BNR/Asp-box repeat-containing protein [Seinonella peptonophila]|uniref:BNR/Asp-box repeat-containing protein n=2 Tax=Seinonella peptonophila TaxID=112248 RepID=A0A1M5BEC9_9BACL|nr:BNR/Asp-box repeat-containing protein [Seinonella peptonophila]